MKKRIVAALIASSTLVAGGCAVYPVAPVPHRGVVVAPAPVVVGPPAVYGGWGYRPYHRHHHHHYW